MASKDSFLAVCCTGATAESLQTTYSASTHPFLDQNCPLFTVTAFIRRTRARFHSTDDINNHLRYDWSNKVVSIFRHIALLKQMVL